MTPPALAGTFTVTGSQGVATSTATVTHPGTVNRRIVGPNGQTLEIESQYTWGNQQLDIERQYAWPDGQSSTQSTYRGDGQGNYTGTVHTTNRQEQTRTFGVQGRWQRAGNTWQHQGTVTGTQGQTVGWQEQGTCRNGQCTGQQAVTFGDGSQRQRQWESQRTAPGTWESRSQITNRQGQTQNRTGRRSP